MEARELEARPRLVIEHEHLGAALLMALDALLVVELLLVRVFVAVTAHTGRPFAELLEARGPFASVAIAASEGRVLRGEHEARAVVVERARIGRATFAMTLGARDPFEALLVRVFVARRAGHVRLGVARLVAVLAAFCLMFAFELELRVAVMAERRLFEGLRNRVTLLAGRLGPAGAVRALVARRARALVFHRHAPLLVALLALELAVFAGERRSCALFVIEGEIGRLQLARGAALLTVAVLALIQQVLAGHGVGIFVAAVTVLRETDVRVASGLELPLVALGARDLRVLVRE